MSNASAHVDGNGLKARFSNPLAVAYFGGAILVRDGCTLRRVTPGGTVSTWVGVPGQCESRDGIGNQARLLPGTIAVPTSTGLLLLDGWNDGQHRGIKPGFDGGVQLRRVDVQGEVTTLAER